jgi:hypothetical protein
LLNAAQKTEGTSQLYLDKAGTQPVGIQGQPMPARSFKADTDIKKDINPFKFRAYWRNWPNLSRWRIR